MQRKITIPKDKQSKGDKLGERLIYFCPQLILQNKLFQATWEICVYVGTKICMHWNADLEK